MGVRRWVAGALCLPLLVLAGCSDDEPNGDSDPTPSVTATDSPSATESTTPEPEVPELPTLPAAAEGSGDKAARAFARYWIAMVNYAQATGDTAPLEALHAKGCSACAGGVKAVNDAYEAGNSVSGGSYSITKIGSVESSEPTVHVVGMVTRRSVQKILDEKGAKVSAAPAGLTSFKLYLRKDNGGWIVGSAEVLQ